MTPFYILGYTSYVFTTILGIIAFQTFSKSWRRQIREPHPVCKRFLIVSLCFGLYLSLWGSYVYFNLKIVTKDGDKIKFRDAVGNFVKSPAFQEFQQTLDDLLKHMWEHGFWSTVQQLVESLDPLGEKHALKELGLERGATQEDIRGRYKELTKKWHPDMFTDPAEKAEAHER